MSRKGTTKERLIEEESPRGQPELLKKVGPVEERQVEATLKRKGKPIGNEDSWRRDN